MKIFNSAKPTSSTNPNQLELSLFSVSKQRYLKDPKFTSIIFFSHNFFNNQTKPTVSNPTYNENQIKKSPINAHINHYALP